MPTVTIRVVESDLKEWITAANLRGLSISEWIRRACLARVGMDAAKHGPGESERDNGNETNQNVSRAPRDSSTRRRGTSAGRRSSPPGTYSYPRRVDSVPVSEGNHGRVEAIVSDSVPSVESIPVPVIQKVIHTATSNRLTCLCNTCTLYRKNNSLPIGGLPKKEKAR